MRELIGGAAIAGAGGHQDHRNLLGTLLNGFFQSRPYLGGGTGDRKTVDPALGDECGVLGIGVMPGVVGCLECVDRLGFLRIQLTLAGESAECVERTAGDAAANCAAGGFTVVVDGDGGPQQDPGTAFGSARFALAGAN